MRTQQFCVLEILTPEKIFAGPTEIFQVSQEDTNKYRITNLSLPSLTLETYHIFPLKSFSHQYFKLTLACQTPQK